MIDTHSHLFVEEFDEDLPAVIERARDSGVSKVFMPNIDDTTLFFRVIFETEFAAEGHTFHNIPSHGSHCVERLVDSLFIISFRFFFRIETSHLFQLVGIKVCIVFRKRHVLIQASSRSFAQSCKQADTLRTGTIYFLFSFLYKKKKTEIRQDSEQPV